MRFIVDKSKPLDVDYLHPINVKIGIENTDPAAHLVVESLALRFQSRRPNWPQDKPDPFTTVVYPEGAISIPPAKADYCTIPVTPNLNFFGVTNEFEIAVTYRLFRNKISKSRPFTGEGWFILIHPAPRLFGKTFISYKEPEDRSLANQLFQFATDAGFEPYMAPPDIKTGSLIWGQKIPAEIKSSRFMFVIWTRNTPKGPGVKKEIRIAREQGIRIVPLLAENVPDPMLFGRDVEYKEFDVNNPALAFAQVVDARRGMSDLASGAPTIDSVRAGQAGSHP